MRFLVLTALAIGVLGLAKLATGEDYANATVYYQVTYDDGTVRDQAQLPPDDTGIKTVLRIARYESELPSYETVTTGNQPVEVLNPGRTIKTTLLWTGRDWQPAILPRGAENSADCNGLDVRAVASLLGKLTAAMTELQSATDSLRQAETVLGQSADPQQRQGALLKLQQAREAHSRLQTALLAMQSRLGEVLAGGGSDTKPMGQVKLLAGLTGPDGQGVVNPIAEGGPAAHRVQLWPVDLPEGEQLVRVSMAHAAAGPDGAFMYVAYADTDKDGRPDTLLAHSPKAHAPSVGGWSQWAFRSDLPRVYVGNTWGDGVRIYRAAPTPEQLRHNWSTLSTDVWFSGFLGEDFVPGVQPYLSNLRVHVEEPNPDFDVGPRVIIREQD